MTMRGDVSSAADATTRRVVAIINPVTRGNSNALSDILRATVPSGVTLDIVVTDERGSASRIAREASSSASIVVAVGGDGTVADVAGGILGTGIPLGIIPVGSTNIVAKDLNIPLAAERAAALLFGTHQFATIDVGRCGPRVFLHMAGAGLDSQFFERTNPSLKRRLGWFAYVPSAIRALRFPASTCSLRIDGQLITVHSRLILVANGGSIAHPRLQLVKDIRPDDGWLDVLIFTGSGVGSSVRTLRQLLTRQISESGELIQTKARRVELTAEPPLKIQLDGDVVDRTPAVFTVHPAALRVIVPVG